MTINVLDQLAALVKQERQALLSRWRQLNAWSTSSD